MHYLSEYQSFDNVQELNHHVSMHERAHTYDLTPTIRRVLRFIARYSVKYPGASHLKVDTIAEGIGKSNRTVRRAIKTLTSLGIIDKRETTRKKRGGDGANIYVIRPCHSDVSARSEAPKPTESSDTPDNLRKETEKSFNLFPNYNARYGHIDQSALKLSIPQAIFDAMSPFFDAKGLYDMYGVLLRAKASVNRDITLESHADEFVTAFKHAVFKYKKGKIRNLSGYLYRSCQSVCAWIERKKAKESGMVNEVYYDWIADNTM